MNATHPIASFVQGFFQDYMAAQRGLSPNTIRSYKDAVKLFLRFSAKKAGNPVDKLTLEDFNEKLVVAFLDDLEATRGNSVRTRNTRLAAVHSFFRYVAGQEPAVMGRCHQICAIPVKRSNHNTIEYLEDEEMRAVLQSADQKARHGVRDYALLLFLYNTGARVQEAVDLKIEDLRFATPAQAKLMGKGRKQRACPLWPETVVALKDYIDIRHTATSEIPNVFLNSNGRPITRFGIRHIVRGYAAKAAEARPSLHSKKVGPHTLRHTTAMHLLQSGNDINVIKDWLGHADLNTTHGYVEIDMKMKRKALDTCQAPKSKTSAKKRSKWFKPGILEWLEDLSSGTRIMCSAGARPATVIS